MHLLWSWGQTKRPCAPSGGSFWCPTPCLGLAPGSWAHRKPPPPEGRPGAAEQSWSEAPSCPGARLPWPFLVRPVCGDLRAGSSPSQVPTRRGCPTLGAQGRQVTGHLESHLGGADPQGRGTEEPSNDSAGDGPPASPALHLSSPLRPGAQPGTWVDSSAASPAACHCPLKKRKSCCLGIK